MNIFRQVVSTRLGMLVAINRILQNCIPVLGRSDKEVDGIVVGTFYETLTLGIKANQLIRVRKAGLGGTYPTYDMTFSFIKNIGIFVNG
jgi:hypothetical protein